MWLDTKLEAISYYGVYCIHTALSATASLAQRHHTNNEDLEQQLAGMEKRIDRNLTIHKKYTQRCYKYTLRYVGSKPAVWLDFKRGVANAYTTSNAWREKKHDTVTHAYRPHAAM